MAKQTHKEGAGTTLINDPIFEVVRKYVEGKNLKGIGWFFAAAAKEKLTREDPEFLAAALESGKVIASE